MNNKIKVILAKGLLETYMGKSAIDSATRAGCHLKASNYIGPEGSYHDEWAADFNGGGQELVETKDGNQATRVYAGGTLAAEKLVKLGLTKKDVIGKLAFFVNKLKDKTRLDTSSHANDGLWTYTYKVVKSVKEIPLDVGEEQIKFKNILVFLHFHIISPVI